MKKSELAWLYSPNVPQSTALNRLKRWMSGDNDLMAALSRLGYRPNQRILTPAMVKTIVDFLGEPDLNC